jgi:hypothetical protein
LKKELAIAICKTKETGEFHLSVCRRSIIGGYACDDKQLEKNPCRYMLKFVQKFYNQEKKVSFLLKRKLLCCHAPSFEFAFRFECSNPLQRTPAGR